MPASTDSIKGIIPIAIPALRYTNRPFNLNFFCHQQPAPAPAREAAWRALLAPYYRELGIDPAQLPAGPQRTPFNAAFLDVLRPFRPAVISFHFGLPPDELIAPLRAWGATIIASATTVAETVWLAARGVDAIIAQGLEAGGHRGMFLTDDLSTQVGSFALILQIVQAIKILVIAASGITDARGVKAALALGAAGMQAGTAYLLCPEAKTSAVHRAALKHETARHTAIINSIERTPGSRYRQPADARTWPDQSRRIRISFSRFSLSAAPRLSRTPRQW